MARTIPACSESWNSLAMLTNDPHAGAETSGGVDGGAGRPPSLFRNASFVRAMFGALKNSARGRRGRTGPPALPARAESAPDRRVAASDKRARRRKADRDHRRLHFLEKRVDELVLRRQLFVNDLSAISIASFTTSSRSMIRFVRRARSLAPLSVPALQRQSRIWSRRAGLRPPLPGCARGSPPRSS